MRYPDWEFEGADRFGRLPGTVTCGGRDIGKWLVQEGHAIAAYGDRYLNVEREAREAKRGMWGARIQLRSRGASAQETAEVTCGNKLRNWPEREIWQTCARWFVLLGVAIYFITLLKCAWLSDDYFITLRQVEQLFAGNGIRFNPYERAFLSTSVAYFFILLPLRLITADPFVIHAIFALTCNAVLLWLLWKLARGNAWVWLLGLGLLFASKAHFDYSWFGQENPLGHALVAALVLVWLRMYPGLNAGGPPTPSHWRSFVALIAVAPLYRHDLVLLAWPLAAWALWDNRTRLGWSGVVRTVAWMLAPLLAWTLFSLVYFGFPLPASAYAKAVPEPYPIDPLVLRLSLAWDYYRFSLHKDGLALAVIFGSQLLWLGRAPARAIAGGVALTLVYIVLVGGDYMGGRFLTVGYVSLVALACGTSSHWHGFLAGRFGRGPRARMTGGAGACLALWIALWPHSPLAGPVIYDAAYIDWEKYPKGVSNERAAWHRMTGIGAWRKSKRNGTTYPDHRISRLGILLDDETAAHETFHICSLGMGPYKARLDQSFLDIWGLADSFMARLPAVAWRPGHFRRVRPPGLAMSLASGVPSFPDPGLNRYFAMLRDVTGGERLWSPRRIGHVMGMNLGLYDDLIDNVAQSAESTETVPDIGDVQVLRRVLENLPEPDRGVARGVTLCDLMNNYPPGVDALLRRQVP
ncbi:MAG: thermonuclease family protein [Gammaproteobacteria bacterium]|nr:thermonuclease family protein [Gammaproteobacteria bacterium]